MVLVLSSEGSCSPGVYPDTGKGTVGPGREGQSGVAGGACAVKGGCRTRSCRGERAGEAGAAQEAWEVGLRTLWTWLHLIYNNIFLQ